jgi:tellurite resistance protein TerC
MISYKQAKRIMIAVLGGTVVLIGLALIVLPGPAFIVIPAGLAILATEFEWARRWLRKVKERLTSKRKQQSGAKA